MRAERVQSRLKRIPGWRTTKRKSAITRTYSFPDFRTALAFVQFVGELAEACQHHPDIDIRYSEVTLTLSTHDEGGLTVKDFTLASAIDLR